MTLLKNMTFCCILFVTCNGRVQKIRPEIRDITESVYASGTVKSVGQYEAYEDLERQVRLNARQSRNNLAISTRLTEDYTLRSEIDGLVYKLPRKKGEIVGPQTPLALIGEAGRFVLELQVDEYDIIQVKPGMPVLVTIDSYKGELFRASVTKIDPLMNERSKTSIVEAQFAKPLPMLYPHMTFEANIVTRAKSKALLVPRSYMLDDSTAIWSNGDRVVVKTGLKDYQMVERRGQAIW